MNRRHAARAVRGIALLAIPAVFACGIASAEDASSLVDAVQAKSRDAAIAMIDQHVDVKQRSMDGTTALHWAAHYSDRDLVKRLLKAGADPSAVNDYGSNPLQEAAVTADPEVIGMLLKAGANADAPNKEGQTALMVVARSGNVEAARLLLSHGARINATEQWGGQSALMWAAAQKQAEMVKFLISKGADVNARGIVRDWQRRVTAEGRPKNMNRGGFTPLLYAAREGCIDCIKNLLKGHADINLPDPDGVTPLNMALLNMHFDTAAYLISQHADVEKWDFFGRTPLYMAIDLNTVPRGGRPDLPSLDSTTGLQIAELLLKAGADPNPQLKLRPPYRNGVFDRGGDVVIATGATPLLVAAKVGDAPAVALLLKYKANIELPNSTGVTPLMAAAGMGHSFNPTRGRYKTDDDAIACVKLLQDAGGKINAKATDGQTALHSAAEHGWDGTVKLLVADGADLQPKDSHGLTPIDHAAGKQERQFLEPEHIKHDDTMSLLKGYIVASTGQPPIEFTGTLNRQTRGTAGAAASGLQPGTSNSGDSAPAVAGAGSGGAPAAAGGTSGGSRSASGQAAPQGAPQRAPGQVVPPAQQTAPRQAAPAQASPATRGKGQAAAPTAPDSASVSPASARPATEAARPHSDSSNEQVAQAQTAQSPR